MMHRLLFRAAGASILRLFLSAHLSADMALASRVICLRGVSLVMVCLARAAGTLYRRPDVWWGQI